MSLRISHGDSVIFETIRWNWGQHCKGQLVRILIGRRNVGIRRIRLDITRGFGILTGWELADSEEAIDVLRRIGDLGYTRIGTSGNLHTTFGTGRF